MGLKVSGLSAMNNPRMETEGTPQALPGCSRHNCSVSLTAATNRTILTSVFLSSAEINIMFCISNICFCHLPLVPKVWFRKPSDKAQAWSSKCYCISMSKTFLLKYIIQSTYRNVQNLPRSEVSQNIELMSFLAIHINVWIIPHGKSSLEWMWGSWQVGGLRRKGK